MLKTVPYRSESWGASPPSYVPDLPLRAVFHPMGYSVEISSNSHEALHAASTLWRHYPRTSDAELTRIRVIFNPAPPGSIRQPSPPCIQGHLFSIVHGAYDFAVADLSAGFAFASLSQDSISDASYFGYYFLEPLAYVMLGARHFVYIHASCISRNRRAIVLCGDSGSGKTCLAYACARRGWEFVSGDAVHIVRGRDDRMVIGRPYEIRFRETARRLFPELNSFRPVVRANGKLDLEIETGELSIPTVLQSFARHIVFIERSNITRLEKRQPAGSMRKLAETICYGDDRTRLEQRKTLEHFIALPVWRLHYSDLDQAERTLGMLLDGESLC
jgi:hypothetical protein